MKRYKPNEVLPFIQQEKQLSKLNRIRRKYTSRVAMVEFIEDEESILLYLKKIVKIDKLRMQLVKTINLNF